MPASFLKMPVLSAFVLSTYVVAGEVLQPVPCDSFGDEACDDASFSLLQKRHKLIEGGADAVPTIAITDGSVDLADKRGEGGDAAQHGEKQSPKHHAKHHRPKPEWSEALLQRAARTSFSSSFEKAVSAKLFGRADSRHDAVHGAQQLAKVAGNASSGKVKHSTGSGTKSGTKSGNCTLPSEQQTFEAYLNCLADRCEDGAPELSGGVACSVMLSTGCGTDIHSLHGDVPAGVFVGRLCAASCGWCGDDPRAQAAKAAAGAAEMLQRDR